MNFDLWAIMKRTRLDFIAKCAISFDLNTNIEGNKDMSKHSNVDLTVNKSTGN